MKVYVVATGEYSDYHVVAVFSTKQLAKLFVKRSKELSLHRTGDEMFWHFMEMELDELKSVAELGLRPFSVRIYEYTGYRDMETKVGEMHDLPTDLTTLYQAEFTEYTDHTEHDVLNCLSWQGWARDKDHAVKIASDTRRQKILERLSL